MQKQLELADVGREPFRIFFPEGVLAGVVGVVFGPCIFRN